jgi:hypothetical protein
MAIPNFITDTFQSIPGEFANSVGPFVPSIGFDPLDFPSDLISLPSEFKLPSINQFQKKMMQTILTETGRSELFTNPFGSDLGDIRARLNSIISSPGTGSESGGGGENQLAPAATDLLETLEFFESHTDRLCGLVEPGASEAQFPTLERALAVGSSLNHVHQILDGESSGDEGDGGVADNQPQLGLFGSVFGGLKQFDALKSLLALPDSNINSDAVAAISSKLTSLMESDVNNYTIGLKKLKRLGVASIVFGAQDQQVASGLFEHIASDFTKGLFVDNTTSRNEAQVAETSSRLNNQSNSRANTVGVYTQDFRDISDLIKANGLFEGIPMNPVTWKKLREMFPPKLRTDGGGYINDAIAVFENRVDMTNNEEIKRIFTRGGYRTRAEFLLTILKHYWSQRPNSTLWSGRGDIYFDFYKRTGSVSKLLVIEGFVNVPPTRNLTQFTDPNMPNMRGGGSTLFRMEVNREDDSWTAASAEEEAAMIKVLRNEDIDEPLVRKMHDYGFLNAFGYRQSEYWWRGGMTRLY